MTKRPLVTVTLGALALIMGCADDPTSALREQVAAVTTSVSYVEIVVGGPSASVTAELRDGAGNALDILPEVTSANTAVATVTVDELTSGKPAPKTNFTITAQSFGETIVTAQAEGLSADITVRTVPQGVVISGSPGVLTSGSTAQLTATVVDAVGNTIPGFVITWTGGRIIAGDFEEELLIADLDQTGLVSAQGPVFDDLDAELRFALTVFATVELDDSTVNGLYNTVADTAEVTIAIDPQTFTGTLSAAVVTSGQLLTITRGAGEPVFDSATEFFIDGDPPASVVSLTADDIRVQLDTFTVAAATPVDVIISNAGPDRLSFVSTGTLSKSPPLPFDGAITDGVRGAILTVTEGAVAFVGTETVGPLDGTVAVKFNIGADATTGTTTFLAEDWGVGVHELQINGVGVDGVAYSGSFTLTGDASVPANPDDTAPTPISTTLPTGYLVTLTAGSPDDYHAFDNTAGPDVTFTFSMNWSGTGSASSDMDLILFDCAFTTLKGFAASLAQPEVTTVTIPAGECWLVLSNLYAGADDDVGVVLTQ